MTAVLHLGDCLEVMKGLPDKSIDCFICDLPYGIINRGFQYKNMTEEYVKKMGTMFQPQVKWDMTLDLAAFWTQVKRLAKTDHTPVIMFCNTKFGYELIESNKKWFRYDLVWDRGAGVSFLRCGKMPMSSHEMIYIFSKKGAYYTRIDEGEEKKECSVSVLEVYSKKGRDGHPTEKPKDLYRWLLRRYVPEGGTVLDPTAGSFNSILVAKELGYKAIGIEKNPQFYWKAVQKIIAPV